MIVSLKDCGRRWHPWKGLIRRFRSAALRDVAWSLVANVGIVAATAATGVAMARLLGPVGRGQLTLIILWPMVLCWLMMIGFPQAFAFYAGRNPGRTGGLTKLALCVAAAQGTVVLILAAALLPVILRGQGREVVRLAELFSLAIPLDICGAYLLGIVQGIGWLRTWNVLRI